MVKILFYVLPFCLWEIEATQLNIDVNKVIEYGIVPNDNTIGIYEGWLDEYADSEAVPYLENLIWLYYHSQNNEKLEFKHLKAFLKFCKDEIELFPMSNESRDKLLNLPDNVLISFKKNLEIPDKADAVSTNKVYLKFLKELLEDDDNGLLRKIVSSMDNWDEKGVLL